MLPSKANLEAIIPAPEPTSNIFASLPTNSIISFICSGNA